MNAQTELCPVAKLMFYLQGTRNLRFYLKGGSKMSFHLVSSHVLFLWIPPWNSLLTWSLSVRVHPAKLQCEKPSRGWALLSFTVEKRMFLYPLASIDLFQILMLVSLRWPGPTICVFFSTCCSLNWTVTPPRQGSSQAEHVVDSHQMLTNDNG